MSRSLLTWPLALIHGPAASVADCARSFLEVIGKRTEFAGCASGAQTGDAPRHRRAFNVRGSLRCREACRRTWLARARTKTLQDRGCGPNARRFRRAIGQVRFPGRSGIVASAAVLDMLRVEFRVIGGFDPVKPTSPRFALVKSRPSPGDLCGGCQSPIARRSAGVAIRRQAGDNRRQTSG